MIRDLREGARQLIYDFVCFFEGFDYLSDVGNQASERHEAVVELLPPVALISRMRTDAGAPRRVGTPTERPHAGVQLRRGFSLV